MRELSVFCSGKNSYLARQRCCSKTNAQMPRRVSWGHGGRVVTLSPPTSEARVPFPAWPQVGKLVVACRWSAVYSKEP